MKQETQKEDRREEFQRGKESTFTGGKRQVDTIGRELRQLMDLQECQERNQAKIK